MRYRRSLRALVVAATAIALVESAAPASAATALAADSPIVAGAADTYAFATSLPYWSAVAIRPSATVDYDLRLSDPRFRGVLAGSYWGTGQTDLIAINSNSGFRPLGPYLAQVSKYSGTGVYSVMYREERLVVPVPTDPVGSVSTAIGLRFDWPVMTVQMYLGAGQGFRVYQGDETRVFLAGSTPGQPSTYLRTRSDLENAYVVADHIPAGNGAYCRVFAASSAGWYGVIVIWNSPWTPPPYDGGNAVFLQRYDPSQGDTLSDCPVPVIS